MTRYATARRVQTDVKIKKLMEAGDHHHDQADEAYASVPSTMIAKRTWTTRIGSMRASMKAMLKLFAGILSSFRDVVVVVVVE